MRTKIVGILNLSPNSLNNSVVTIDSAISRVSSMVEQGADCIDVGAQSSRPGVKEISLEVELARLRNVVRLIKETFPKVSLSVDTTKYEVARMVLGEGVDMINDISGGRFDTRLVDLVRDSGCKFVLMHSQGVFNRIHMKYVYRDIIESINSYFGKRVAECEQRGVDSKQIICDPGIGFSKSGEQNMKVLKNIDQITRTGFPVYVSLSRKKFTAALAHKNIQSSKDNVSTVLHAHCVQQGVSFIRTHNVGFLKETLDTLEAIT